MNFYFHQRLATPDIPEGYTVSKTETLPKGDFKINEYIWPNLTLWFVDIDDFTDDERETAYLAYLQK